MPYDFCRMELDEVGWLYNSRSALFIQYCFVALGARFLFNQTNKDFKSENILTTADGRWWRHKQKVDRLLSYIITQAKNVNRVSAIIRIEPL